MASCENDHERIEFDSPFSALCPLCAMRERMKKEAEAEAENMARNVEDSEYAYDAIRRKLEAIKEELRAYKEAHP